MQALKKTAHSPTLEMHELSHRRVQSGENVYHLGFGQSPFEPPPSIISALKSNARQHYYTPVKGLPELRQAVAGFHARHDQIPCTADQVYISTGSKTLLFAIMAAHNNADVLVPVPGWVSYIPQAQLAGQHAVQLRTEHKNRWRVTPGLLEQNLKDLNPETPKILILNYPGNPDGLSYTSAELSALAEVCRKYDVLVISDEIYARLHFNDEHLSIARLYPEKTIITGGLSKWCGAGGWRLGTAVLPTDLIATLGASMEGVLSEIVSCAPTPVQLAAIAAFEGNKEIEARLKIQRRILNSLAQYTYNTLSKAGVKLEQPQGGFYAFLDFTAFKDKLAVKGLQTSENLCHAILEETGVAILHGTAFGMGSEYLSARLAYVDFDGQHALSVAANTEEITEDMLREMAPRTYDGIEKLAQWLTSL